MITNTIMGIAVGIGLVLAGSDGPLFPIPNIIGIIIFAGTGLTVSRWYHEQDHPPGSVAGLITDKEEPPPGRPDG